MGDFPLLFLLIALGAFMFFASRRQKKAMQATINLHESLREGDRVHTTSGLQGTIGGITDDSVDLEIAPGVVTTLDEARRSGTGSSRTDDDDDHRVRRTIRRCRPGHRDHGRDGRSAPPTAPRATSRRTPTGGDRALTFRTGTYLFRVRGERSQARP